MATTAAAATEAMVEEDFWLSGRPTTDMGRLSRIAILMLAIMPVVASCAATTARPSAAVSEFDPLVLAGAFRDQVRVFKGPFLVMRESHDPCFARDEDPMEWAAKEGLNADEQDALKDHQHRNTAATQLPLFSIPDSSRFVFEDQLGGAAAGKAPILLHLSVPGYSHDFTTAIVCAGASWSALGGEWEVLILERDGSDWRSKRRILRLQM